MAERKVDWGMQTSYCRPQAKIVTCIIVDLQLIKANSSIPFHYSIPLFHSTDSRQPVVSL